MHTMFYPVISWRSSLFILYIATLLGSRFMNFINLPLLFPDSPPHLSELLPAFAACHRETKATLVDRRCVPATEERPSANKSLEARLSDPGGNVR